MGAGVADQQQAPRDPREGGDDVGAREGGDDAGDDAGEYSAQYLEQLERQHHLVRMQKEELQARLARMLVLVIWVWHLFSAGNERSTTCLCSLVRWWGNNAVRTRTQG